MPEIPEAWEAETGGPQVPDQLQQFSETLSNLVRLPQNKKNKRRTEDVAQWPSPPGFNPQYQKNKKKIFLRSKGWP